jgi:hypothetical protein
VAGSEWAGGTGAASGVAVLEFTDGLASGVLDGACSDVGLTEDSGSGLAEGLFAVGGADSEIGDGRLVVAGDSVAGTDSGDDSDAEVVSGSGSETVILRRSPLCLTRRADSEPGWTKSISIG